MLTFFDTEEAHVVRLPYAAYRYPVMPIFSRRYLLASRDVVTEVGFKEPRRSPLGLPRCKPNLCDHCKTRWNSF